MFKEIAVSDIVDNIPDFRIVPEDYDLYHGLKDSIRKDGLVNPITVLQRKSGLYSIIAGRRRLRAIKELGQQSIMCRVYRETDEINPILLSLVENLFRKNLTDTEKAYGLKSLFEQAGYSLEQTRKGITYLKDMELPRKTKARLKPSGQNRINKRMYIPDEKFKSLLASTPFSPDQAQLLISFVEGMDKKILEQADSSGLTNVEKKLLINSKIKNKPKIQGKLVNIFKNTDNQHESKAIHKEVLDNIENKPELEVMDYLDKKEKQVKQKHPNEYYLDLTKSIGKVLLQLAGRALTRGEWKYTKEIIDKTKDHRLRIIKSMDSDIRTLETFNEQYLKILRMAVDEMIDMINTELNYAEKKQEMLKR